MLLVLTLGGCAAPRPASTPADWAALADALSSEEYAETFLDEFKARLSDADSELSDDQADAVYRALLDGAETQRAILDRSREVGPDQAAEVGRQLQAVGSRTDTAVEAVLTPNQRPIYRALQADVRAALAREVAGA